MAVILNNQKPIGDVIAQGFGSGIGQGINHLLEQKLASMKRQEQYGRYSNALDVLGLPKELAALDQDLLKPILTEHAKAKYRGITQGDIRTVIPQLSDTQAEQINQYQPGVKQRVYEAYTNDPVNFINNLNQIIPPNYERQSAPQLAEESLIESELQPQKQVQLNQQEEVTSPIVGITENLPKERDLIAQGLSKKEAQNRIKDIVAERKTQRQETQKAEYEAKKANSQFQKGFADSYQEQEPDLEESLTIINRLEKLVKSGKIKGRGILEQAGEGFLKKYAGTETQAFKTPAERQFEKDVTRLQAIDAKALRGPVGAAKIKFVEKEKPSIEDDPETNLVTLRNYREKAEKGLSTIGSIRKLIAKNDGKIPDNLALQVQGQKEFKSGRIAKVDGKYIQMTENGGYKEISEEEANKLLGK